jgi:PAS domain S-box-containing protein
LQNFLKPRGVIQVGVFALRSRGKVNGCIVFGSKRPAFQQDEGVLTACATQIALMLDMMKVWRLAQTNEKKYQSLIENNPDAIFEMDLGGNVLAVNQAMEEITGYSEEELCTFKRGALIAPEDLERAMQYEKYVLEGFPQTYEVSLVHKDGHYRYVSMNRVPIQVDGMTIGIFGIAKDITERELAEEMLRKSEKLAVVGQLAAGVAHEIRNPLTSLKGFVQLMSENSSNASFCEIMQSELDRINEIVSEFLMIAKPQVRRFEQEDILALVQDVANLVRVQGIMNNVQISVHYDTRIPLVFSDRDQLKQVFLNILKNAIDAMPNGGDIQVFVMHRIPNQVIIRFEDYGCGIPKERIIRLGEPFYTTKEKGTGLGLMVSYKILEAHQGSIKIQSEVGKGTTVDVILPC